MKTRREYERWQCSDCKEWFSHTTPRYAGPIENNDELCADCYEKRLTPVVIRKRS